MPGGFPPEDRNKYTTLETALNMPIKELQTPLQKDFSEKFVLQASKVHTSVLQQLQAHSLNSLVSPLQPEDYENSNDDQSSTVRVAVGLEAPGKGLSYSFIAKLLPNDGPCALVFQAGTAENESLS